MPLCSRIMHAGDGGASIGLIARLPGMDRRMHQTNFKALPKLRFHDSSKASLIVLNDPNSRPGAELSRPRLAFFKTQNYPITEGLHF